MILGDGRAELLHCDCMEYMASNNVNADLVLTDIPYDVVNRKSNNIRSFDKGSADRLTFNLAEFLDNVYKIARSGLIIFCSKEQLSTIHGYFHKKQESKEGTVRQLVWQKSNPSPVNGEHVYLSGIENAVWFRKRGGYLMPDVKTRCSNIPLGATRFIPLRRIMSCFVS